MTDKAKKELQDQLNAGALTQLNAVLAMYERVDFGLTSGGDAVAEGQLSFQNTAINANGLYLGGNFTVKTAFGGGSP